MKLFRKDSRVIDNGKTWQGMWFFWWLVFGFGISKELWYLTPKRGELVYHIVHIGYTQMHSPDKMLTSHLVTITFLLLNIKLGFVRRNKVTQNG